jgi:hypothetical protein
MLRIFDNTVLRKISDNLLKISQKIRNYGMKYIKISQYKFHL